MTKIKTTSRRKKSGYAQILNPIYHLERKIEQVDRENDKLQQKVLLLSVLSVVLAVAGILLAIFYNH